MSLLFEMLLNVRLAKSSTGAATKSVWWNVNKFHNSPFYAVTSQPLVHGAGTTFVTTHVLSSLFQPTY